MASIVRTSRKKNWFWHKSRGNYWETYCKSITAANVSSQWMMNGGKRYSSKHFMHVAHLQVNTSHIIQYQHITSFKFVLQHIRMSFKALLFTSQRIFQKLSLWILESIFSPKTNDAHNQWQGPPCASASSACAAVAGWGTASTASRWKIHPWGNVCTSGTQKVI